MAQHKMPHADHDKHLCYLVNLGYQQANTDEFKHLVRDAQFVCKKCGRVAAKKANLCVPIKL